MTYACGVSGVGLLGEGDQGQGLRGGRQQVQPLRPQGRLQGTRTTLERDMERGEKVVCELVGGHRER